MRVRIDYPEVVNEVLDGEVVIVNFKNGRYYSLENVGGEIWTCISSGLDTDAAVAQVTAKYEGEPTEIEREVNQFVAELLQEGLVVPTENPAPDTSPSVAPVSSSKGAAKAKFRRPVLVKYEDMEGLLLLDVAHDEDAALED